MKYDSKFYTKKGLLNDYALSCGYIEKHDNNGIVTKLFKEHDVYHVRQHDFNNHNRIFWDSFDILTNARNRYFKAIDQGGIEL